LIGTFKPEGVEEESTQKGYNKVSERRKNRGPFRKKASHGLGTPFREEATGENKVNELPSVKKLGGGYGENKNFKKQLHTGVENVGKMTSLATVFKGKTKGGKFQGYGGNVIKKINLVTPNGFRML